ncbi:MAG: FAD-dependent oxidoreductase, partial [Patescibacteria group bacterium]
MYDVIIIGGGMAGMTAAIYSTRRQLKTLVIAADKGGQMAKNSEIENWPGGEKVNGADLSQKMFNQTKKFGAEFKLEFVKKINFGGKKFEIETVNAKYQSKTLILAFGMTPKRLDIPGEDELVGRGISYCVTCDGPFFRQKDIAIVGGGNSAVDAALMMSKIAKKVYLIHRREQFRAEEYILDKVKSAANVEMILNTTV